MAAPSIGSGITRLDPSDQNTYTSGTFGTSDGSIASSDLGVSGAGIDPDNTAQGVENANGPSTTSGNYYSARSPHFSSGVDISSANQAIVVHFKGNIGQFNRVDNVRLCVFSGGGTTQYAEFDIGSASDAAYVQTDFVKVPLLDANITRESGSFDNTDVSGFYLAYSPDSTGTFGVDIKVDQIVHIDGEVEFANGDGTTAGTFKEYRDLLYRDSGETYHTMLNAYLPPAYGFGHAVRINSVEFTDSSFTFIFLPINSGEWYNVPTTGYYSLTIDPSTVTAEHTYTDGTFAFDSGTYDLTIDASSLTTGFINVTRCVFLQTEDVVLDGADLTMTDCTITNPATCDIANADLTITINNCTAAIQWTADLIAGSAITTDSDIDITFAETDLSDITITLTASNTITVSPTTGSGTYDLSGLTTTGTVTLDNATANNTTITLPAGTSNTVASPTTGGGTITVDSPAVTYTFNSDTAATLIRYFEDDSQTVVDSATGTTLAYEFPDADPVDAEFLKQGYVPVNRQDIVPTDGGTLDIIMDFDEAYNSANGLTITTEYDYNRATKVLTINSDQEALDVRSSLADVIRTNTGYYNTSLLMVAIPGLTRVDLTDGATITSMATWKGAGMEMFDSADALNPVEKWFSIKSVGTITGATTHYRQTDSGNSTAVTLTSNVVNESFQYWDDPDHDGTPVFDYSDYMVIKSFLAGSKQGRVDVLANSGLSALNSNLFTVPLSNAAHDYSGSDPGITADITLVAGSTVGGVAFSYEIVDGGTNTGEDIADQLNYNAANNPNTVIAGGTGLRYFELPDMVIHNATSVETERGYEEGTTPALVGFYCSRGGSDHPDFTRFQGDNGTYYTPAVQVSVVNTNLISGTQVQIYNVTQATELYNDALVGAGLSEGFLFGPGQDIESGDSIRYRAAYHSGTDYKEPIQATAVASGGNITFLDVQADWLAVEAWAVDGSTVTEFTADTGNIDIDLDDGDGTTQKTRLGAWWAYLISTTSGIANFWGAYSIPAANVIKQEVDVLDVVIHNVGTLNVRFTDNDVRYYRSDNSLPYDPTGNSIFMDYTGVPDVVETGVSGLTTPESNQLFGTALETTLIAVGDDVDLLVQDQGLDLSNPKVITEITEGESYDEDFDTINKTIRKVGNTTTITRTS